MMLPGGLWNSSAGTDYGGCAGRITWVAGTDLAMPAGNTLAGYSPYQPAYKITGESTDAVAGAGARRWGIFGQINSCTMFGSIRDGTSNTIMTGELQRLTDTVTAVNGVMADHVSQDGWAVAGAATLFSTGNPANPGSTTPTIPTTPLINNRFAASPGSEHSSTANFGMGDGSVRSLNFQMDSDVFSLLGSMADGVAVPTPD